MERVSSAPNDETVEYRQYRFSPPEGSTVLVLVRHGESAPGREGAPADLTDGHSDPDLDPVGVAEADLLADRLAGQQVDAIYVTPLRRTAQTAAPLAARLNLKPTVVPELREVHLGEWEGFAFRKYVREMHPVALQMFAEQRWDVIPGAESTEEFTRRVRA